MSGARCPICLWDAQDEDASTIEHIRTVVAPDGTSTDDLCPGPELVRLRREVAELRADRDAHRLRAEGAEHLARVRAKGAAALPAELVEALTAWRAATTEFRRVSPVDCTWPEEPEARKIMEAAFDAEEAAHQRALAAIRLYLHGGPS